MILPGGEQHQFDYFAAASQSTGFMQASINQLGLELKDILKDRHLEEIFIWSDGGMKTYGTVYCLDLLAQMLNIRVIQSYFAPYHGRSRCDAHFGRGKLLIRKYYPTGGLISIMQVVDAFKSIPNTRAVEIDAPEWPKAGSWSPTGGTAV